MKSLMRIKCCEFTFIVVIMVAYTLLYFEKYSEIQEFVIFGNNAEYILRCHFGENVHLCPKHILT